MNTKRYRSNRSKNRSLLRKVLNMDQGTNMDPCGEFDCKPIKVRSNVKVMRQIDLSSISIDECLLAHWNALLECGEKVKNNILKVFINVASNNSDDPLCDSGYSSSESSPPSKHFFLPPLINSYNETVRVNLKPIQCISRMKCVIDQECKIVMRPLDGLADYQFFRNAEMDDEMFLKIPSELDEKNLATPVVAKKVEN